MAAMTPVELEATREAADARVAMALIDALFLLVGVIYGARVLRPLPKTYLSEIAFPRDFCIKQIACATLFLTHGLQWLFDESVRTWQRARSASASDARLDSSELFAMTEALVWGMASTILWMEYRRSRTPSAYLRTFWLVKWIGVVYVLVVFQCFTPARTASHALLAPLSFALAVDSARFVAMTVLALLCFVAPTPISVDLVSFPQDVVSPTALLHSQNAHRRFSNLSNYGSFRDFDWLGRPEAQVTISSNPTKPRCVSSELQQQQQQQLGLTIEQSASTRSSVAMTIAVTIPSSTTSIWGKHQFVSYKIVVQTEDDAWTVRRHYNDFVALHDDLPDDIRESCVLPPNLESTANRGAFLSWKGRPRSMKSKLESYLQLVLCHPALEPSASQGLCDFLEMEYVDDALTRSYHSAPRI